MSTEPIDDQEDQHNDSHSTGDDVVQAEDAAQVNFESDIDTLRAELENANDQIIRGQAELDNFRKRTRRDLQEQVKYATLPLMRELVDVLDNLTRALEASDQSSDEGLMHGVQLVADQLAGVLQANDCNKIETVGQPFDPNMHESIRMVETDETEPGMVVREIQVGYHLFDRVIRPAKVFVSVEKS